MNDDGVERWKAINFSLCGATAETGGGGGSYQQVRSS